ncbi:hypothetical protein CC1G_07838 [Coprinopsis cinerea okayama7|uniref:Uncharacterized protein n=1 Tax=Coprinopsis cinerea (strain Okayama-7 / 130 / ATCC MYA-4618 / FGSC 9003) TaxID=240176 RepID=A8P403_COPC7|nr:hypothetical protein CC1G_07838 [Coprinopsis cinerea okayama7\|eukprot:XP_001838647.2 hypothetical protein CC1G_07838 [Coprinopsis cinerea okayama7\
MALCERKRLQDELKRERKEKKELKAREKRQKEERERDQQERWKLMLEEVNRERKAALEEWETKWTAKLEEQEKKWKATIEEMKQEQEKKWKATIEEMKQEQEKKWKATIEETKKEQELENERWREEEKKWKATIQATVQHLVNKDVEALDKIRLRNLLNRAQEKILVDCGLVHESASPETFRSQWQAIFQGVRSNRAQHLRAYFKSTNAPKSVLALLASDETLALLAEEDRMEGNLAAHPAITARRPYEEVIGRALAEARDAFTQLLDYII